MTAYRKQVPMCPLCSEGLSPHRGPSGETVDLCGRCGGVWIDWTDGDLVDIARSIPPVESRDLAQKGRGPCPSCGEALAFETHLSTAVVLRCAGCLGAFVPYASIGALAAATPADARADQADPEHPKTGFWERIVNDVRALMGHKEER